MPRAKLPLDGLEIVLAGGAGGLGAATGELLREEGAKVVVGSRSHGVRADITKADDRLLLLDAAPNLYGLVVFTGTPARGDLETALRESFETNFAGPVLLAREAAARMRAMGTSGAIVLLSTMQAVGRFPGSTAYASAKAALQHSAGVLAKESRGIRVNVVAPGVIDAGMAQASIAAGKYDRYVSDGVIPRFGRAMDVAQAVRFFLEPDNYITGQVLAVDGGITL